MTPRVQGLAGYPVDCGLREPRCMPGKGGHPLKLYVTPTQGLRLSPLETVGHVTTRTEFGEEDSTGTVMIVQLHGLENGVTLRL